MVFWWSGSKPFGSPLQMTCAPTWDESRLPGQQVEKTAYSLGPQMKWFHVHVWVDLFSGGGAFFTMEQTWILLFPSKNILWLLKHAFQYFHWQRANVWQRQRIIQHCLSEAVVLVTNKGRGNQSTFKKCLTYAWSDLSRGLETLETNVLKGGQF